MMPLRDVKGEQRLACKQKRRETGKSARYTEYEERDPRWAAKQGKS